MRKTTTRGEAILRAIFPCFGLSQEKSWIPHLRGVVLGLGASENDGLHPQWSASPLALCLLSFETVWLRKSVCDLF